MKPLDLAAIKARAEAALNDLWISPVGLPERFSITLTDANADFIAHARTDIPMLLAEVERLQAENVELRKFIDARIMYSMTVTERKALGEHE